MNKVQLIGYLGKDPVYHSLKDGKEMAYLRLATDHDREAHRLDRRARDSLRIPPELNPALRGPAVEVHDARDGCDPEADADCRRARQRRVGVEQLIADVFAPGIDVPIVEI